ncbi:MAG: hypothetical protein ACKVOH_00630 [Chlamydiales bacterium]
MILLQKGNIFALPAIHYTMELASLARKAFNEVQPDCVAVEFPQTLQEQILQGASRLPDVSVAFGDTLCVMIEPCDASLEVIRSAQESGKDAYCIDLDVDNYPLFSEPLPDAYAIFHIGLEAYYQQYRKKPCALDEKRELYMARRLKELSLQYERVLFVGGMAHVESILAKIEQDSFPEQQHVLRKQKGLATLTEESCRDCLREYGWISCAYEEWRCQKEEMLDRQKLLLALYKAAQDPYQCHSGHAFPGYNLRNTMKYVRNLSLLNMRLQPVLFEVLTAAKGCVDHNYALEVWKLATDYPYRKNIDNLPELPLSIEEIWGHSKLIKFHLKQKSPKAFLQQRKNSTKARFYPPSPFSICSYPPEDIIVEEFGDFLRKKGNLLLREESAYSIPFLTSLEEGIDTRETIRHFMEKKLYVKVAGRPPGQASSVVVIFEEDDKYRWNTTWLGEHNQESDMAFYATLPQANIVGPGISRCEYGGFMMTSPPGRLMDVWRDPDYVEWKNKGELLLRSCIDYAIGPVIVYVAKTAPRSKLRTIASRYGKKICYIPIGQLSTVMLNKIRLFHVLDGHDKREIAGDYIY